MAVTITWTGHSTFLVDTGEGVLLIDPFLDDCPTCPIESSDVHCDAILITHGHFDHVADAVTVAKRTQCPVLCAFEIAEGLAKQGIEGAVGMNLGGTANVPGGAAKMEMAHHSSSLPDGTYAGPAASWLLDVGGKRLFIAGDTCLFSDMERIGKPDSQGRQLDLAILPIGDMFTMGPTDALEAIRLLRPKSVMPGHFGTWPPIEQDVEAWAQCVRDEGVAEPHVCTPGQSVILE